MARRKRRRERQAIDWHTAIADRIDLIMGLAFVIGAIALAFVPR